MILYCYLGVAGGGDAGAARRLAPGSPTTITTCNADIALKGSQGPLKGPQGTLKDPKGSIEGCKETPKDH